MEWNLGTLLDHVGAVEPTSRPALIHGDRTTTWAELTARSNNIAHGLHKRGVAPGARVAFYLRNTPEYMEFLVAALKGRLTHVNVNYRYRAQELIYILDNSDSEAVVYDSDFREQIEQIRERCPLVKLWIEVGEGAPAPAFATPYETLATEGDGQPLQIERDPHDLILLYTGGTTGMPKGVMWTHHILMSAQLNSLRAINNNKEPPHDITSFLEHVRTHGMHVRQLPAAPMMHATGMTVAMGAIVAGGCVITLPTKRTFDAGELWAEASRHRATSITIVGDAFAKPMLAALEAAPGKYDLSSVQGIVSSGVVWSTPVKQGLIRHMPQVLLLDSLGSTEAPACGATISTKDGESTQTLDFRIGPDCKVFDDNDQEIVPGSGQIGYMARSGFIPLGYFKDEAKTAQTFKTIGGVRYAIPGDLCQVEADGRLVMLGRRSSCINTGGEKVFAEEVEETLKSHPAVDDANVFGVPDETWGQAVIAVIAPRNGASVEEATLRQFVHERLAGYKTPKRILVKATLERHPNGKPNYERMREYALQQMQAV